MLKEWRFWASPEGHETEEKLLLHIDGVLEPREDERVERHLRDCWQCRAKKVRMEAAIAAFMEERQQAIPDAEPSLDERFRRRLEGLMVVAPPRRLPMRVLARRVILPVAAAAATLAGVGRWDAAQRIVIDFLAPAGRPAVRVAKIPAPPLTSIPLQPRAQPAPDAPLAMPEPAPLAKWNTDAAELAAYLALEEMHLCCGNDTTVLREANGTVRVKGVVSTRETGMSLVGRLSGFPEARVEVESADDLAPAATSAAAADLVLAARQPLFERRLKEHFRKLYDAEQAGKEMAAYASRSVRLAYAAQQEARTLRVLAEAFPGSRVRRMSAEERQRFAGMVRSHATKFEEQVQALEAHWSLLAGSGAGTPRPQEAGNQPDLMDLETRTKRISELAEALFAGLEIAGAEAQDCWIEIRRLTRELDEWRRLSAATDLTAWLGPAWEHSRADAREKE
ncbi:MAG: zf-HC2 domain-containing protein [Acidobacteria bacterium]|nr:zf-HC2 domain-containing protein [Acidobacteriota bacterium]